MEVQAGLKAVISNKAYPIPIELRPLWRIALIVISIGIVSGNKKYLDSKKLNILVWMLIRKSRWNEYESYLLGKTLDIPLVSVDTATYKALELSVAKEFIRIEEGKIHVIEKGEVFFTLLVNNDIMLEERDFLAEYGKKLTDQKVKSLTGGLL